MNQPLRDVGILALLLLALGGCEQQVPATYKAEGLITAASRTAVDSDTNDPFAPYAPNNTPAQAQTILNPVVLGGFVTLEPTGVEGDLFVAEGDPIDSYRVNLTKGQILTLKISDWEEEDVSGRKINDLDLYLYTSRNVDNPVDVSMGIRETESLTIPASGQYDIVVVAQEGASNYVLRVGEPGSTVAGDGYRLSAPFVPGEAIVRFRERSVPQGGVMDTADSLARSAGMIVKAGAPGRAMLLSMGEGAQRQIAAAALGLDEPAVYSVWGRPTDPGTALKLETLLAIKALRTRQGVELADPNYIHDPLVVPDDPFYSLQWHYPVINLPQAWDRSTGDADVRVAVIDTGVYLGHADLSTKLVGGYDFVSDTHSSLDGDGIDDDPSDPGPPEPGMPGAWHGTHVAGTVAAVSDNGLGVAGVAWNARVTPLRAVGVEGGNSYDVRQAVRYAAGLPNDSGKVPSRPADVINLSLGCADCFSSIDQQVYSEARDVGVILVAAAGNQASSSIFYPASYDGVVSVSAVSRNRQRAFYSNFGPWVDVAAPGGDQRLSAEDGVLSTLAEKTADQRIRAIYEYYQGTSMASAHVAGVAALMKSVYPGLTPSDFDNALATGSIVQDLGVSGRDDLFGHGLIDALKAVQHAEDLARGGVLSALVVSPESVDLGSLSATAEVEVAESGADLTASVNVEESADWLSVEPPADPDGLGVYTLRADRSDLADGPYATSVVFTARDAGAAILSRVAIQVRMRVSEEPALAGDTGRLYVLLMDEDFQNVAGGGLNAIDGEYPYSFVDVPSGSYYLIAGTDSDNDGSICDRGEACGAYPTLSLVGPFDVEGDRSDLDFTTTFGVPLMSLEQQQLGADTRRQGLGRPVPETAPKRLDGSLGPPGAL